MAIIDTLKDKLGNIIYPKTLTKAVYDETTGNRLDNTLNEKANLDSPHLTGVPTSPTATKGTNTTQLATTAFVQEAIEGSGSGDMLQSVYDPQSKHEDVFGYADNKVSSHASDKLLHRNNVNVIQEGTYANADGSATMALSFGSHTEGQYTIVGIGGGVTNIIDSDNVARTITVDKDYYNVGQKIALLDYSSIYYNKVDIVTITNIVTATPNYVITIDYVGDFPTSGQDYLRAWQNVIGLLEPTGFSPDPIFGHAEGFGTVVSGKYGHAEGKMTYVGADYSHAEGIGTYTLEEGQTVVGKYNDESHGLFVVGNGTDIGSYSTAFEILENGEARVLGEISEQGQKLIDKYVAQNNLKTVNNISLIGTGNISVGDMAKSVYDTNNNGIVDNAEALNGQAGSYYLNRANQTGTQTVSTISDFTSAVQTAAPAETATSIKNIIMGTDELSVLTGGDYIAITDVNASNTLKKMSITNFFSELITNLNNFFASINHTHTASDVTNFASTVLSTVLTGLSTATNAVITTSDTVLIALGKLQKQISDNLTTLTNHINDAVKHITATERTNWNTAYTKSHDHTNKADLDNLTTLLNGKLNTSLKGTANGLAELGSDGKVPSAQLPAYVDDVIEGTLATFPAIGEAGKIYVDTTTNLSYRWSGTQYTVISPSLALGETSSTAFVGDKGKIAYDHSQTAHAPADATHNSADSYLLNRTNHTGTQLASTISDLKTSIIYSVTCGTAAATAAKVCTCGDGTHKPASGEMYAITYTLGNTVANVTHAINGDTARNVRLNGANVTTTTYTLAANSVVLLYFDGTYFNVLGSQRTTDSDVDTYDRLVWNNTITAGEAIYSYKLLMQGTDGKFYPLTLETGTGTTKTVSTQEFMINSPILYYSTTTTVAQNATTVNVYSEIPTTYLNYTANASAFTSQMPIYLKGTILANGNFKLDNTSYTSWLTQTLPTTEDGFVYIMLGYMYSTTGLRLTQCHCMVEYKNGKIRPYTDSSVTLDIATQTEAETGTDNTKVMTPLRVVQGIIARLKNNLVEIKSLTVGSRLNGSTVGDSSVAEGFSTTASGAYSHAEGLTTKATGYGSHAEGSGTISSNNYSHAEGSNTTASGDTSHAEGRATTASGMYSHAQNYSTKASGESQTAIGKYNVEDTTSAFIIGNGTGSSTRSNALTVDWNGNVNIPTGATYQINGVPIESGGSSVNISMKGTGVIPTTGWTTNTGDYAYKLNYPINGIVAFDIVELILDENSVDVAYDCGLCPTIDSYEGGITLYAVGVPTNTIPFTFIVRVKNIPSQPESVNPIHGTSTIPMANWVANTGDYAYKANVAIASVTSLDNLEVTLDTEIIDVALTASLCPTTNTYDGGVTFYASKIPTADIPFTYFVSMVGSITTADIPYESSILNIQPIGTTASVGTLGTVARADHVHAMSTSTVNSLIATTANLTYYVNASTGNDNNDGLTSGTAFKTIMKSINILPKKIDHSVTINVASGSYAEDVQIVGFYGAGAINLYADTVVSTNYSTNYINARNNVVFLYVRGFNLTSAGAFAFYGSRNTQVTLAYCNMVGAGVTGIQVESGYYYTEGNVISNKSTSAILVQHGARVFSNTNSGSGNAVGLYCYLGGYLCKNSTQPSATLAEYMAGGLIVDSIGNPVFDGNVVNRNQYAAFEMGSVTASGTPYIDFHSSGNNIDYDSRIIASGGTTTGGKGALDIISNVLNLTGSAINVTGGNVNVTGMLTTTGNTNYTTRQVRNVIISTADADLAQMQNGDIWIKV